jgi:multicomponent Na+:H+ antiporter subunit A
MLYMASFLLIIFGSVAIKIYADKTFDFALFQLSGNLETDTFLSILLIATCLAATSIIFIYRFIVAAIILGLVGASLAVLFAWFGAADLAFTQILAELLIAVFVATFGFKLKDLPTFFKDGIWFPRMLLAICFGICLFFLTLIGPPLETEFIARDFYLLNALDSAFGRNVVNVILVDFRALDTLNEVIVVLIAAIGVTALRRSKSKSLRLKRGAEQ